MTINNEKTAVILMNLGGPDKVESIKPFLFNLFNDKAIIPLPTPIRWCLAKFISTMRNKKASEIYGFIGGKSPILSNTKDQSQLLEKLLKKELGDVKTFIGMRYWHPFTEEAVIEAKKWGATRVVLLPLYPQFSTTTTGSSFEEWYEKCKEHDFHVPTYKTCCYPNNDHWIEANSDLLKIELDKSPKDKKPIVLFSAHGLPESIIKSGDPYQFQVEKTAKLIEKHVRESGYNNFDSIICYQSRVGPKKWIGPNTEDILIEKSKEDNSIIVHPIAFVSEHSETLVELDIEYKEIVDENKNCYYGRVPTVSCNPKFIQGLKNIVMDSLDEKVSYKCPEGYEKCYCKISENKDFLN